ncbi:hypothetical protein [Chroococcidiopsis cubana]|nr:hypothetical protein [Chroococcidiopsis cubana]
MRALTTGSEIWLAALNFRKSLLEACWVETAYQKKCPLYEPIVRQESVE